jgi:lipopolysaccharide/colanic/teichoic acid biosynthesis glycosyltransferase
MGPLEQRDEVHGHAVKRTGTPGTLLGARDSVVARPTSAADAPMNAAAAAADWRELEPRGFYARGGQRALCLALILIASPIVLVAGTLVALANLMYFRDPRRVFFVQERVGRGDTRFTIVKFRTMSEPKLSTFEAWSSNDAARVTRLGRFLRNTHLDELPQLWNVLRGEMSLFGPRPEMVEVDAWARGSVPGFTRRLAIAPGLTGLSQVTQGYTGRDVDAYREKLEGDLVYIASFGLAQDLGLLLRTVVWVLRGRGWRWRTG